MARFRIVSVYVFILYFKFKFYLINTNSKFCCLESCPHIRKYRSLQTLLKRSIHNSDQPMELYLKMKGKNGFKHLRYNLLIHFWHFLYIFWDIHDYTLLNFFEFIQQCRINVVGFVKDNAEIKENFYSKCAARFSDTMRNVRLKWGKKGHVHVG